MNLEDYELDVALYRNFYYVCKSGSFSKAAKELGVTQPNISYSIKKLEDNLGIKLFERGNTLVLTPEAETLLPYVEESLNSLKKGNEKINDLINLQRGQICIGIPSHIGVFLLVDLIKKFNSKYSNVRIKVMCKPTKELFKLLKVNAVDMIIDCSPLEENIDGFIITKIATEKCGFACNKKRSDLLNKKNSLDDIAKQTLIVPSLTSSNTKKLVSVFEKHKKVFSPKFEIATSDMIAEMVSNDIGIGYLFEKTVSKYNNLQIMDVNINLPEFDIFMIYKDYLLSVTMKEFINFVKKQIKK